MNTRVIWLLGLIIPVGFFILIPFLEKGFGWRCFTACEDGPIETLQALVLFCAAGVGVMLLRLPRATYPDWARAFFTLGVVGALYAGFEEVSYGQRIFGWLTPESWQAINDQHETNLHNTSAWLDQKPRIILEVGVLIGGLVIPALRRWKNAWLPQKWNVVYPENAVVPTALIAIGIHVLDFITEKTGYHDLFFFERGSEAQEFYLFWFILLYFIFKKRELTS